MDWVLKTSHIGFFTYRYVRQLLISIIRHIVLSVSQARHVSYVRLLANVYRIPETHRPTLFQLSLVIKNERYESSRSNCSIKLRLNADLPVRTRQRTYFIAQKLPCVGQVHETFLSLSRYSRRCQTYPGPAIDRRRHLRRPRAHARVCERGCFYFVTVNLQSPMGSVEANNFTWSIWTLLRMYSLAKFLYPCTSRYLFMPHVRWWTNRPRYRRREELRG